MLMVDSIQKQMVKRGNKYQPPYRAEYFSFSLSGFINETGLRRVNNNSPEGTQPIHHDSSHVLVSSIWIEILFQTGYFQKILRFQKVALPAGKSSEIVFGSPVKTKYYSLFRM